jgi:hypothetical protein
VDWECRIEHWIYWGAGDEVHTLMPILEEIPPTETRDLWVYRYTDSLRMTRTALGIAFSLAVLSIGVVCLAYHIVSTFQNWRPLVYRVDAAHRAVAESYNKASEGWNETDARCDLEDFVRFYYSRDRQTISSPVYGFPRSLWYLSEKLATKAQQDSHIVNRGGCDEGLSDACTVATYLADGTAPDIAIRIVSKPLEGFRPSGQWKSTITFWADQTRLGATKSTLNTMTVTAEYLEKVPDDYLPTDRNPRGLSISQVQLSRGYGE